MLFNIVLILVFTIKLILLCIIDLILRMLNKNALVNFLAFNATMLSLLIPITT